MAHIAVPVNVLSNLLPPFSKTNGQDNIKKGCAVFNAEDSAKRILLGSWSPQTNFHFTRAKQIERNIQCPHR
ncbi:hypothetical protein Hypma_016386 [Hypsizygus marmoreus]|uniref:Uncharacterized protein n=1 Tax=Hypsizygus marmoreus TaxID=39966 RepID=A0A369IY60_HYPMA|nr:hypothetical protein Hypma_016386 [Hypsizygus marmoreus]